MSTEPLDLPLDDEVADLPLDDEQEENAELPLDDDAARCVPEIVDVLRAGRDMTGEPDVRLGASIAEILPADFPLPVLIRFVPRIEHKRALDKAVVYALGIDVVGREKLELADSALGAMRHCMNVIKRDFEEPAQIADQLHKGVTGVRADWLREAEAATKTVGTRVAKEKQKIDDAAAAERRRQQALADQQAREEAQARVEAAKKDEAPPEVVESLQSQANVARAEPVRPPAGTAGASLTLAHSNVVTTWKARFAGTGQMGDDDPHPEMKDWTDLHRAGMLALCKAVLDGHAPIMALGEPNWQYLDARAVADQKTLSIPGIEAFASSGARAKGQRRR